MAVSWQAGRVRFRNDRGTNSFDSNKRTLLLPSFVQANITLRAVDTSSTGAFILDEVLTLGSCHPLANVVLGFVEFRGRVHALGGSFIAWAGAENMWPDTFDAKYESYLTGPYRFSQVTMFHLKAEAGVLKAYVTYRSPTFSGYRMPGGVARVFAWCGTFDY